MDKNRENLVVRTRCPQCFTPYSVDAYVIQNNKPVFQCKACDERFFFAWPQPFLDIEIQAYPFVSAGLDNTLSQSPESITQREPLEPGIPEDIPLKEIPTGAVEPAPVKAKKEPEPLEIEEKEDCPVCHTEVLSTMDQCYNCKADLKALRENPQEEESEVPIIHGTPELQAKWQHVVNNWNDRDLHQEFIDECHEASELSFAAHKYGRILSMNPLDAFARPSKKKIQALVEQNMLSEKTEEKSPTRVKVKDYGLSWIAIVLSLAMISFGLLQPEMKNLVGLGAALLALVLGVRWLFRANAETKSFLDSKK